MKNILKIFIDDVKRIRKNVIAMIVVIGVLVVPCLYAWFNIAASWDPYNNTGNLKVAVASVDEGYTGSLIPLEINVGEQVISALRENTQMDWVFTMQRKGNGGGKIRTILCGDCCSGEIQYPDDESVFRSDSKAGNYLLFQCQGKCDCTKSDRQGCNRDPETGESGIYTDNIRHGNDGVSVGL